MLRNALAAADRLYRRTGANLPHGDPTSSHGALMEGYFWRLTERSSGRVIVALCGVNRHRDGDWATVAVASHPEGTVASVVASDAWAADDRLQVNVPHHVAVDGSHVHFEAHGTVLTFDIDRPRHWPRPLGGGGVFSAVPFLSQYWHPHVLGGTASGTITMAGRTMSFRDAEVYAEKNWGRGFPDRWWWGQAHDFDDDVSVAFGGGDLHFRSRRLSVGGVVLRLDDHVVRLTPPAAIVSCDVSGDAWRVRARSPRYALTISGDGAGQQPHILPVPVPAERRNIDTDIEHLAATMHVDLRRDGRPLFSGTSNLAGLETGTADEADQVLTS